MAFKSQSHSNVTTAQKNSNNDVDSDRWHQSDIHLSIALQHVTC